jgi:anti-anti-sigma factor
MLRVHARNMGNVSFLCMQGQLVRGQTETLRNAVHLQSEAYPDLSTVVLDLTRVSTVDAGGLGVMLELREQVEAKGIGFKLMNVSKLVGKVLEVTRLDTVFEITAGVESFPAVARRRPDSARPFAFCA